MNTVKRIVPVIGGSNRRGVVSTSVGASRESVVLTDGETSSPAAVRKAALGANAASLAVTGKLFVNGVENGAVKPCQPADLILELTDAKTGEPIRNVEIEHEKPGHLILSNLQQFAHLHPTFYPEVGRFAIALNWPSSDPDNQDAARAVTAPGPHFLFFEVKPKGLPLQRLALTLTAEGTAEPVNLKPDLKQSDGSILKYFRKDGRPGTIGDAYQVTLTVEKMDHGHHKMIHFNVNLKEGKMVPQPDPSGARFEQVEYSDVTNIEPWLGMMGHLVQIGKAGDTAESKEFRHLHSGHGGHHARGAAGNESGGGPDLMFMLSEKEIPPPGIYALWAQCKHQGRVLTFPFVVEL